MLSNNQYGFYISSFPGGGLKRSGAQAGGGWGGENGEVLKADEAELI
jgi:hypothetical protein